MGVYKIKNISMIYLIHNFNFGRNDSLKKIKRQKKNSKGKKFELSEKEKEIVNKKIIDIKELYEIEYKRTRNKRIYNQLNKRIL